MSKIQLMKEFLKGNDTFTRGKPECVVRFIRTNQSFTRLRKFKNLMSKQVFFKDQDIIVVKFDELRSANGNGEFQIRIAKRQDRLEFPVMIGDVVICFMYYGRIDVLDKRDLRKNLAFLGYVTKVNVSTSRNGEVIDVFGNSLFNLFAHEQALLSLTVTGTPNITYNQETDDIDRVEWNPITLREVFRELWKEIKLSIPNWHEYFVELFPLGEEPVWNIERDFDTRFYSTLNVGIDEEIQDIVLKDGMFKAHGTIESILESIKSLATSYLGKSIELFVEPVQMNTDTEGTGYGTWRGLLTMRVGKTLLETSRYESEFQVEMIAGLNVRTRDLIDDFESVATVVIVEGERKQYPLSNQRYHVRRGIVDMNLRNQDIERDQALIKEVIEGSVVLEWHEDDRDDRMQTESGTNDRIRYAFSRNPELHVIRVENLKAKEYYGEKVIRIQAEGINENDKLLDVALTTLVLNSRKAVYGYGTFLEYGSKRAHLWNSTLRILDSRPKSLESFFHQAIISKRLPTLNTSLGAFSLFPDAFIYKISRWFSDEGITTKVSFSTSRRAKNITIEPSLREAVRDEARQLFNEPSIPKMGIGKVIAMELNDPHRTRNDIYVNLQGRNVIASLVDTGYRSREDEDYYHGIFCRPQVGDNVLLMSFNGEFYVLGRYDKNNNMPSAPITEEEWLLVHKHGGRIHFGDIMFNRREGTPIRAQSNLTIASKAHVNLVGSAYLPLSWHVNERFRQDLMNSPQRERFIREWNELEHEHYIMPVNTSRQIEDNSYFVVQHDGFRLHVHGSGVNNGITELVASRGLNIFISSRFQQYAQMGQGTGNQINIPELEPGMFKVLLSPNNIDQSSIEMTADGKEIDLSAGTIQLDGNEINLSAGTIHLADGTIHLADGTKKFAREQDEVSLSTAFRTWLSGLASAVGYVTPLPGEPNASISSGSDKVMGGD